MFDSLLFPRFRHLWESDSEGVELTQKVEALIAQRTRGLMACPSSAPLNELAPVLPLFRHIFDSRRQPRPDDPVWLSQGYRGDQVKTKDGRVIFFRT